MPHFFSKFGTFLRIKTKKIYSLENLIYIEMLKVKFLICDFYLSKSDFLKKLILPIRAC